MTNDSSEFITDGFEGISSHFTNVEIVKQTGHNVLARAQRYGQWWMLKGLLPDEARQPIYQEMLRKELELMMPLQHPNIVRAFELDTVDGIGPCIVMDWVDGMTLDEYLQTAHPSHHEQRRLLEQLIDAVAYIHLHGIVHRDLKPQNIMVTRNGANIKVIDFGLADADSYAVLKQPSGTLAYMAPEQAEGSNPDVRNDIYSMGKIMEQMHLGHDFDNVVRRCTERIDRRYHNIDELRMALSKPKVPRRWLQVLAAVLLAAVIVAGGIYVLTRPPQPVYVTDLSQLSNTKQYFIHTRNKALGSLGVKCHFLATTFAQAAKNRCDEPSTFAIIEHEGAYYLYSVTEKRFIDYGQCERDEPLASLDCAMNIHQEADNCFVFDFKACKTVCSLNVNSTYGPHATYNGTFNEMYNDGNLFMLEEAGDFDPTEALSMMQERQDPEYEAALKSVTSGRYIIYTEASQSQDLTTSEPHRYYLKSDGYLTETLTDSCIFDISLVEHNKEEEHTPYRLPAWCITHQSEGGRTKATAFGTPQNEVERYVPHCGQLLVIAATLDSWQDKVLFLGSNGCYAIRATNVPIENWGANLYWAVYNHDGRPEAEYSSDRKYIWKLQRK